MDGIDVNEPVRIDKWLWVARFFKTRGLAAEAVAGGKVEVNGDRPKPSRIVRVGDTISIRRGLYEWTIVVRDVTRRRHPASQAQKLYQETDESVRKRDAAIAQFKLERSPSFDLPGRPSKKDRRAMRRFTKRGW
jgi:ribosome-associated heat shock protein Hsp15